MRILFLSDNFPPEGNAPATRLYEHAVRWVRGGHEVTVVTCAPNFPEGRLFDGYRNAWRQVEQMDGIRVVRVKTYITANEGFLRRTLDYLSFMVMGFVMALFERRPDVVVATSPQFFTAIAGWALSVAKWRPFVFELRDLWPASIVAVGAMRKTLVIRLLERLELFLYRRADAIVSVTESFRRDLVARGIDGGKIHVVVNGVDLEKYRSQPRSPELEAELGLRGKFVAGYIGTHGMAHALDKVVEAAALLADRDDIRFLFVGGGADRARVERMVAERGLAERRAASAPAQGTHGGDLEPLRRRHRAATRHSGLCDGDSVEDLRVHGYGCACPDGAARGRGDRDRAPDRLRRLRAARRPRLPWRLRSSVWHIIRTSANGSLRLARAAAPSFCRDRLAASMLDVLKSQCGEVH